MDKRSNAGDSPVRSGVKNQIKKTAVQSTARTIAGSASAGTSLVIEAGVRVLLSKKGRRGLLVAVIVSATISAALVFSAYSVLVGGSNNISAAEVQSAQNLALTGTPGMPTGLTPESLIPFQAAEAETGIPWEIPFAIAYYESWGGASVNDQPSSCPASTSGGVCPPVSSTMVKPPRNSYGLLGFNTLNYPTLTDQILLVDQTIQQSLRQQDVPTTDGLLSGVDFYGNGGYSNDVVFSPTANAQVYSAVVQGALSRLPLVHQSATLDSNIYQLAQSWAAGSLTSGVSGGGTDMICYVGTGQTVTITSSEGVAEQLTNEQIANAAVIAKVASQMGLPARGVVIGLMVGLQESQLYNLPNKNVPASLQFPSAQFGNYSISNPPHDHTSLGVFQQLNSWGTVSQRMTVSESARLFFQRMVAEVPNWQSQPPGLVAQTVQVSAFPSAYAPWQSGASTLAGEVLNIKCSTTKSAA